MTDENQVDDQGSKELSQVFETPHMWLAEVEKSLRLLDAAHEGMEVYRNYF